MNKPRAAADSKPIRLTHGLRGGRPAWSTAVGLGPIPYRFAGSNPAPRIFAVHRFNPYSEGVASSRSRPTRTPETIGFKLLFDKEEARGRITRGGRPAWSTALRSGRSPYRFAGSNPAPRILNLKELNPLAPANIGSNPAPRILNLKELNPLAPANIGSNPAPRILNPAPQCEEGKRPLEGFITCACSPGAWTVLHEAHWPFTGVWTPTRPFSTTVPLAPHRSLFKPNSNAGAT